MDFTTIEQFIGRELPTNYKNYLSSLQELFLEPSMVFPIQEPTPFGDGIIEEFSSFDGINTKACEAMFFSDVKMLVIGGNSFGDCVCMLLQERQFGSVYYWDHEQRAFWKNTQFYASFSHIAESLREYLKQREKGFLPRKEEGMENFYFVAGSFPKFLEACRPVE